MDTSDAVALIRDAVGTAPGIWADLGAGTGTFTRALAELLGPESVIYAVDRDRAAADALAHLAATLPNIASIHADFAASEFNAFGTAELDGVLLANALHFVRDQRAVLRRIAATLRTRGRVVIVEYDRREASRWVPYPVSPGTLGSLAAAAGVSPPRVTATRPSEYQGEMYTAVMFA